MENLNIRLSSSSITTTESITTATGPVLNDDYIRFPVYHTFEARLLSRSRDRFLEYINEERKDVDTYKKYLIINVSGSEIQKMANENHNILIRKNIPKWAINNIKEGRQVEVILYMGTSRRDPAYFKYTGGGKFISKARRDKFGEIWRSNKDEIVLLNNRLAGMIDIKNIVKTEVNKNGIYDEKINEISEKSNISVDQLDKYGKIKPIYLIELDNLRFFTENIIMDMFMTRFTVDKEKENGETKYRLIPQDICTECKNMVTVWA